MSLDGLRAWIGVVERKLTMRTRVFLVLVAIAIGGAGAGIYLGVDAQNNQVTEGDLQAVQDELLGRIEALEGETGAAGSAAVDPRIDTLEREVRALRTEIQGLEGQGSSK